MRGAGARGLLAAGVAAAVSASLAACGATGSPGLAGTHTATVAAAGASNPTVALDAAGVAYTAWVGASGAAYDVFLARSAGDSIFAAPVRVNDVPGDAAPHPQAPAQVATGPHGDVYVVWQNNSPVPGRRFPASDLRFARSGDGGRTFERAVYVNDDAGGAPTSHTFHDLAVAADGTIYVSWIDGRASEAAANGAAPDDGHAAAAGHMHGAPGASAEGPEIRVARSTDGGRTFEPSRVVDGGACPCCRTSLALGAGGEVYVAWRKVFAGGERDIAVARSRDGGVHFDAPVRVHRDGWTIAACPHAGPAVALDARGRVHVAWYTGADGRAGAWYAVSADGGQSFGRAVRLTPEGSTPTTQVRLAEADAGSTWLAWEGGGKTSPAVQLALVLPGGSLRRVRGAPLEGKLPALSARAGRLALAWLDGETAKVLRGTAAPRPRGAGAAH